MNKIVRGFATLQFDRGWAVLNEQGKVRRICANCQNYQCANNTKWDSKPCAHYSMLERSTPVNVEKIEE